MVCSCRLCYRTTKPVFSILETSFCHAKIHDHALSLIRFWNLLVSVELRPSGLALTRI